MNDSFPYTFGKYEIRAELGRGGFGTVFRAFDTKLERDVAIKVMAPELMRDTSWVGRFQQEARVMAKLDHPHIVPIHDIGEEDGRIYLVLKLIEGTSLANVIENEAPFTMGRINQIISQIASALDHAFNQGIVHRDLKPANVLVSGDTVALTDFGFARLVQDNSQSISISGGIVGTPAYIAPEVWEEKARGQASDIYAMGCILHEMVTGHVLFRGASTPAVMLAHFSERHLPTELPQNIPEGVVDVMAKALARDPAQRYVTATEMAADLQQVEARKLAKPYRELCKAISEKRWRDALGLASNIRSQNPSYEDVEELQEKAQRQVWADEWREQAEALLESGDYDSARLTALRWQEIVPDDEAVTGFLSRLHTSQECAQLRKSADEAIAANAWDAAESAVREWRELAPEDPDLTSYLDRLRRQAVADSRAAELARLKKGASKAIASQEFDDAESTIGRLRDLAPGDEDITTLSGRLNIGREERETAEEIAFWRSQTEEAVATQEWPSASKMVERWLQLAADDSHATRLAEQITSNLARQQAAEAIKRESKQAAADLPEQKRRKRGPWIIVGAVLLLLAICITGGVLALNWLNDLSGSTNITRVPEVVKVTVAPQPTQIPEMVVVEVTREVEVVATPTLPPLPDEFSAQETPPQMLEFESSSDVSPQLMQQVAQFLRTAILAEQLTRATLDTTYVELVFAGTQLDAYVNYVNSSRSAGTYEVALFDYQNSRIMDVNVVNDSRLEADTCEYWRVARYNSNGLISEEKEFRAIPQTITMDFLNSPTGPRWFVTMVQFHETSAVCQ